MMDARRWNQICVEFDGLVAASDVQRDDRVALLGMTDPTLRAAVEQLLRADAEADVRLFRVESPFGHGIRPDESSPPGCSAALQSRLRRALEPTYHLQRELGGGGMSYVFVAEEIAVKRRVVIKMLRPELLEAISMKRFQREIELAANLQHPHIVPLLSAGIADGLLYYTMPLVAGESLRDRLKRENELPVSDTVRILRDVCAALAYAHARGIVHRDIKPANVLLSEGGALVTDFGIAKALRSSRSPAEAHATTSGITDRGLAIGTPRYMAPEQAIDSPDLDHRADLYALGAVAYEMLAGCPPFAERSSQRLLVAHALEAPAPIGARRPSIPTPLAELVMRCLAKQPADRHQSAQEIGALLNRLEGLRVQTPTVEAARARRSRGKFRPILRVLVAAAVVLERLPAETRSRRGGAPPSAPRQASSASCFPTAHKCTRSENWAPSPCRRRGPPWPTSGLPRKRSSFGA
jgi:serine/threonine-protein kinase